MKRQDAMLFLALSAIWGSSFMFIKLGLLGGFGPMTLVSLRLLFGFLVMFGLARRQGHDFSAYRWAVLKWTPLSRPQSEENKVINGGRKSG